jgi:hypothetical protein
MKKIPPTVTIATSVVFLTANTLLTSCLGRSETALFLSSHPIDSPNNSDSQKSIDRQSVSLASQEFVAYRRQSDFQLPKIVIATNSLGRNRQNSARNLKWHDTSESAIILRAADYIREGLNQMTGQSYEVITKPDSSTGIVLALFKSASEDLRNDPEAVAALKPNPQDPYAANEAFFVRTERNRVVVVANTANGLLNAVVELMESANYEVLGMGKNWVHVPNYQNRPLVFNLKYAGRPSYYIRSLRVMSGQAYGHGTIAEGLNHPEDETVHTSYWRWRIGARIYGTSMPQYPGHSLYAYHKDVLNYMRKNQTTDGFLANTQIGLNRERPIASPSNNRMLWVNTDRTGQDSDRVFVSNGKDWVVDNTRGHVSSANLDLSVPFVRQIIFERMKKQAENQFNTNPDDLMIFGIDSEDGWGAKNIGSFARQKNWYPEYLSQNRIPFGRPYLLHNHNGLQQPVEIWDSNAESDALYGFGNWLLKEFDKWIESLPAQKQVTSSGRAKKDLIRCSTLSYNFHDVPPNFNIDSRIRVMIAGFPKNRGKGKWENFNTAEKVGLAFKVLLPQEPLSDYRIISAAKSWDVGYNGIKPRSNTAAVDIVNDYRRAFNLGYRAMTFETDFNFGKQGLQYYLISKALWNADLSAQDLDAIRDRWFQRAFGNGWQEMKSYYNFMLKQNYPACNGPKAWLTAIDLIDSADRKIANAQELDAQKRIDDVKQYWYNLYLLDTGKHNAGSPEFKEFLWRGQMSYMVAMEGLLKKYFNVTNPREAVGSSISNMPAHFTHAETQVWWEAIKQHWQNPSEKCM